MHTKKQKLANLASGCRPKRRKKINLLEGKKKNETKLTTTTTNSEIQKCCRTKLIGN